MPLLMACRNSAATPDLETGISNEIHSMATASEKILNLERKARHGDLVTRTGNDFTSVSLKNLNRRNTTFSHCGIVKIEDDSVFVYHALGGEWNPDQKLRKDPFSVFAEPVSNNLVGLFRYDLPAEELNRFVSLADSLFEIGTSFDMDFNLQTTDKMYCAEFVQYCLSQAAGSKIQVNESRINDFRFIGVDDLFLIPNTKPMGVIKFR